MASRTTAGHHNGRSRAIFLEKLLRLRSAFRPSGCAQILVCHGVIDSSSAVLNRRSYCFGPGAGANATVHHDLRPESYCPGLSLTTTRSPVTVQSAATSL